MGSPAPQHSGSSSGKPGAGGAGGTGGAGGAETSAKVEVHNNRGEIEGVESRLLAAMTARQYPEASVFAVRLALEEAIVNAFRHGHKDRPGEPVRIEFDVGADKVTLAIEDRGPGFDPASVPDPTTDDRLELPTGRGLLLMRAYMARVEYVGRGNRVEMDYLRPK